AGAAESGQRGHVDVPLGDDLDDLDPPTGQSRDLVGDRRGLGPGELGPAGAQAHGASAELLGFDDVEGVVGDRSDPIGFDVVGAGGLRDLRLGLSDRMGDLVDGKVEQLHERLGVVDLGFRHSQFLDLHRRGVDELLGHPVQRFADLAEGLLIDDRTDLLLQTRGLGGEGVLGVGAPRGHRRGGGARRAVTVGPRHRARSPVASVPSSSAMIPRSSSTVLTPFASRSLSEFFSSARISPSPKSATCSNSRTLGSMSCGSARSTNALFAAPLGFCDSPATMSSRVTTTPRAPVQEMMRSASAISSAITRGVSSRARPPTSATRRSAFSTVRLSTVMRLTPSLCRPDTTSPDMAPAPMTRALAARSEPMCAAEASSAAPKRERATSPRSVSEWARLPTR